MGKFPDWFRTGSGLPDWSTDAATHTAKTLQTNNLVPDFLTGQVFRTGVPDWCRTFFRTGSGLFDWWEAFPD